MLSFVTFGALAGLLSTLSPCVLPLIPIVLTTAARQHRRGPLALAAGLALSFTAVGIFVATVGFAIGLDERVFRMVGGVLLAAVGLVLVTPALHTRAVAAAGPIGAWSDERFGSRTGDGLAGQFGVGLLLGAVWAPCVGPTLGAASLMAAQGENLGQVAVTMFAFGLGAALPLLLIGMLSREALIRWRGRMLSAGTGGRRLMGAALLAAGLLILTGTDKMLETVFVQNSPAWLTTLTTRF